MTRTQDMVDIQTNIMPCVATGFTVQYRSATDTGMLSAKDSNFSEEQIDGA